MNRRLMFAALLVLGAGSLSACTVRVTSPGAVMSFETTNYITAFEPDRGRDSSYQRGEEVQFRLTTNRAGYVTLVALDPDGQSNVLMYNHFVREGFNRLTADPGYTFTVAGPRGYQRVRAIFTTSPQNTYSRLSLEGRYESGNWDNQLKIYLRPAAVSARDVVETGFWIR